MEGSIRQVLEPTLHSMEKSGYLPKTSKCNVQINMIVTGRQPSHEWKKRFKKLTNGLTLSYPCIIPLF